MEMLLVSISPMQIGTLHHTTPLFSPGLAEPRVHRHDGVRLLLAVLHAAALRGRLPRRLQRDGAERHGCHREDRRRAGVAPVHAAERRGFGGGLDSFTSSPAYLYC